MSFEPFKKRYSYSHRPMLNNEDDISLIKIEMWRTVFKVITNWLRTCTGQRFCNNIKNKNLNAEKYTLSSLMAITVRFDYNNLREKSIKLFTYQGGNEDLFLINTCLRLCGVREAAINETITYLHQFELAPIQSPVILEFTSVQLYIEISSLFINIPQAILVKPCFTPVNQIPFITDRRQRMETLLSSQMKIIDDLIKSIKINPNVIDRSLVVSLIGEEGPNSMAVQEYLCMNSFYNTSTEGAALIINDLSGGLTAGVITSLKNVTCFNCSYDYFNPFVNRPKLKNLDLFKFRCPKRVNTFLTDVCVGDITYLENNQLIVEHATQTPGGFLLILFINYNHVLQGKLSLSQLIQIVEMHYLDKLHPSSTLIIRINRSYPPDLGTCLGRLASLFRTVSLCYTCRNTANHLDFMITCFAKQVRPYPGVFVSEQCCRKLQQIVLNDFQRSERDRNQWNYDVDFSYIRQLLNNYHRLPRRLFNNDFQLVSQATFHLGFEESLQHWIQKAISRYDKEINFLHQLLYTVTYYVEGFDYTTFGRLPVKCFWEAVLIRHFLYLIQSCVSVAEMIAQLYNNFFIDFARLYQHYSQYFPSYCYEDFCKILGEEWVQVEYFNIHVTCFKFIIWNLLKYIPL